jgi:site-specific recombinase XerD
MDKEYVKGTVLRYERTVRYLEEFLQKRFHTSDIPLQNLNNAFVRDFEHFIRVEKDCAQNATVKYLKNLKKITKLALVNKWMSDDPFAEIHFHQTKSNRSFLSEQELDMLLKHDFGTNSLNVIRDIFCFCAFTGMAFTDVQHLKPEHIVCDSSGNYWIRKAREKTNNMCNIPLLDIPLQIIGKYKSHPECCRKNVVLPVPSNQRMNSYLKAIADICGIKKTLTTHIARHTFATIAIANKVSLEVIASVLGHTDLRTTRIYAKIMDKTIIEEMQTLKQKFAV